MKDLLEDNLSNDEFLQTLYERKKLRPHFKLAVWKNAITLIKQTYFSTSKFPSDERFGLTSQIRRAAVSVALNIAEGSGRRTPKDRLRFMNISDASLSEVETCSIIALELNYFSQKQFLEMLAPMNAVSAPLHGLMRSLKKSID